MPIAAGDVIFKFGTQDEVTSGTPAAIANNAYGKADQAGSVAWSNDDDAPFGAAVLKCQFATMPSVGSLGLFARLLSIQSTNNAPTPSSNFPGVWVGSFPIDFSVANATNFYTHIPLFNMPGVKASQAIDWYLGNENTGQTLSASYQLWITPIAEGK